MAPYLHGSSPRHPALAAMCRRSAPMGIGAMRACVLGGALAVVPGWAWAAPEVSAQARQTAQRVAEAGIALSALADDAPASYTVQAGDTLWSLSARFLKSPWRWPELWGTNLQGVGNPHRIFPGQVLVLVREGDKARLQLARGAPPAGPGQPAAAAEPVMPTVLWSPRVRSQSVDEQAISGLPVGLVAPFMERTVVLSAGEFESAPRVGAGPDGRTLLTRGDIFQARGDLVESTSRVHLFREPRALRDPQTGEVLGYEARLVGSADRVGAGAGYRIVSARAEIGPGDWLAAPRAEAGELARAAPRQPSASLQGHVASVGNEALSAGQHQIVALNRGARDGVEPGHVLAVWRSRVSAGAAKSSQQDSPTESQHAHLMVFSVHERVSHALVMRAQDTVQRGDRFGAP